MYLRRYSEFPENVSSDLHMTTYACTPLYYAVIKAIKFIFPVILLFISTWKDSLLYYYIII